MQTDVFARNPVLRGYWYTVAQSSDVTSDAHLQALCPL
jgi:hypothetical protein